MARRRPLELGVVRPLDRRAGRPRAASAPCPGRSRAADRARSRSGGAAPPATASRVRKLFISTSGTRAPLRSRRRSTCWTVMSRNVCPSRASISDFGPVMPMLVPRPPLSLSTTAWSSSSSPPSGSSSASAMPRRGLDLRLGQHPLLARGQPAVVVLERLQGDLRQPLARASSPGSDPVRPRARSYARQAQARGQAGRCPFG